MLTDWLRANVHTLNTVDPDADLDDLEPLRELIGDVRIVALGENSHFIAEFAALRQRLLRFLVERCGFSLFGFEYGFVEGFSVDDWTRGDSRGELAEAVRIALPLGVEGPLAWMRAHNAAGGAVRFAGIDIPQAGGSLLPALEHVAGYLRGIDDAALDMVEEAITIARDFAGNSAAVAAPAWQRLPGSEQDRLTCLLARLRQRFKAAGRWYRDRSDEYSYAVFSRSLEAAGVADYQIRAMAEMFAGEGCFADTSAREVYMAETVAWHLRQHPQARMVLAAHNAHIQKTPVIYDGQLTSYPLGQHLGHMFGDDYFALALTSGSGRTAEMLLDETAPFGFVVDDRELAPAEPSSIEAAVGAHSSFALAGLRAAPREDAAEPDRIRMHSDYMVTPVLDAYDAVINIPQSTVLDDPDYRPRS